MIWREQNYVETIFYALSFTERTDLHVGFCTLVLINTFLNLILLEILDIFLSLGHDFVQVLSFDMRKWVIQLILIYMYLLAGLAIVFLPYKYSNKLNVGIKSGILVILKSRLKILYSLFSYLPTICYWYLHRYTKKIRDTSYYIL